MLETSCGVPYQAADNEEGAMNIRSLQTRIGLMYGAVFFLQIVIWFFFYRLAGYNDLIGGLMAMVFLMTAVVLALANGLSIRRWGLELTNLVEALELIILALVFIIILGGALKLFGAQLSFLRPHYSLHAMISSLFLESLGQQLLFTGVFYHLISRFFEDENRWQAVLVTAFLYGMWHLPGSLAVMLDQHSLGSNFFLQIASPFLLWIILGLFYYFSENLWLAILLQATLIYPLTGFLIRSFGMRSLFVVLVGALLYWARTRR
jgi:membrane protease YdiL (CAAX protease family)